MTATLVDVVDVNKLFLFRYRRTKDWASHGKVLSIEAAWRLLGSIYEEMHKNTMMSRTERFVSYNVLLTKRRMSLIKKQVFLTKEKILLTKKYIVPRGRQILRTRRCIILITTIIHNPYKTTDPSERETLMYA